MKNLYKIEDELYIVSSTENISENCWIITNNKLVQVSYLLSDEVAKGFKVIFTTNKLLIKDGVQPIDDEFLEWFVKNPSCEDVEVEPLMAGFIDDEPSYYENMYEIIIPKEEVLLQSSIDGEVIWGEPKQETLEEYTEDYKPSFVDLADTLPKQETLEEAAERILLEEDLDLSDYDKRHILKAMINIAKWQQKRSYSEEEVNELLKMYRNYY